MQNIYIVLPEYRESISISKEDATSFQRGDFKSFPVEAMKIRMYGVQMYYNSPSMAGIVPYYPLAYTKTSSVKLNSILSNMPISLTRNCHIFHSVTVI